MNNMTCVLCTGHCTEHACNKMWFTDDVNLVLCMYVILLGKSSGAIWTLWLANYDAGGRGGDVEVGQRRGGRGGDVEVGTEEREGMGCGQRNGGRKL